jgi:hypothetical protein
MSYFPTQPTRYALPNFDLAPRDLQSYALRSLLFVFSIYIFTHVTSPQLTPPAWPLSASSLNNATLGFESIVLLTSKAAFKPKDRPGGLGKDTAYISLPTHVTAYLRSDGDDDGGAEPSIVRARAVSVEAEAPRRKGHTAAVGEAVSRGWATTLVFDEGGVAGGLAVNARLRRELYGVHRALKARPVYEDLQISELGKWSTKVARDTLVPIGPQPVYWPYYRAKTEGNVSVDDYAFERMVAGKRDAPRDDGVGEWDLIFLGDCREKFDEEAQRKLRGRNQEGKPWRRADWVVEAKQAADLWVRPIEDGGLELENEFEWLDRERKKKEKLVSKNGRDGLPEVVDDEDEDESWPKQSLRRLDGVQDACVLSYIVSARGAVALQKHFGASDPGLGTQDLMHRFCGKQESVCLCLGEGVVREKSE